MIVKIDLPINLFSKVIMFVGSPDNVIEPPKGFIFGEIMGETVVADSKGEKNRKLAKFKGSASIKDNGVQTVTLEVKEFEYTLPIGKTTMSQKESSIHFFPGEKLLKFFASMHRFPAELPGQN